MGKLVFAKSRPLTLGVEMELQLLDEPTFDLNPISPQVLAAYKGRPDRVKAEIFQSMLEINTGVCEDAHQVHQDLKESIVEVQNICKRFNSILSSSGTHPFAVYQERKLFPAERYTKLIDRNQWIARRLMIFGLHFHIGMRDGEHAIQMNNALIHYLPMLLALSASSPYWHGEETEMASSRITFFEALPTGGHPCVVQSWEEFEKIYEKLYRSKAVTSVKDIWWDIRPSPEFGTLEIRICDTPPTFAEVAALTALIHCLCRLIDDQLQKGRRFKAPPDWIMRENKWRASRHGVNADLIINEDGDWSSLRVIFKSLLKELDPYFKEYNYDFQKDMLVQLIDRGPSYLRQKKVFESSGKDLKKVTESLAKEFQADQPAWE